MVSAFPCSLWSLLRTSWCVKTGVLDDGNLRDGVLLGEAERMQIPVVSETALSEALRS